MSNASTRGSKRLARAFAATILALSFLTPTLFTAAPASAHTHLVKSFPSAGARLAARPSEVVLTFNQPIQAFPGANGIVVIGPRSSHWPCGRAHIDGNTLTASIGEVGRPGRYQIDYRVLGADGHPITGSVPIRIRRAAFTASKASAPSTVSAASDATAMSAFDVDPPHGLAAMPTGLWIALLAAIAVYVGAVVRRQTVRPTDAT
jgi:methionine-rich copper-binding protein CopC